MPETGSGHGAKNQTMDSSGVRPSNRTRLLSLHERGDHNELLRKAIDSSKAFKLDHTLVHGNYSYLSVYDRPAPLGTYSIGFIDEHTDPDRLKAATEKAKVLLIMCMD